MNKLGRGALENATCQISKLHAFQFQRGKILKLVCFVPMFHLVTAQGHYMNKLGRGPQEDFT